MKKQEPSKVRKIVEKILIGLDILLTGSAFFIYVISDKSKMFFHPPFIFVLLGAFGIGRMLSYSINGIFEVDKKRGKSLGFLEASVIHQQDVERMRKLFVSLNQENANLRSKLLKKEGYEVTHGETNRTSILDRIIKQTR